MANFHLKVTEDGAIYAGSIDKKGRMNNKSEVTEEALAVARDHLIIMSRKENKMLAYRWDYPTGKTILLKIEEMDTKDIKEEE